ncbi:colicin D family protein [Gordonia insulae]|uniref:Outer membrane channel protein CpnT n=1 Tax=Gordonia insulae TaxID=2420509 RepID=A0A3G8JL78_9ACTN|nr:colicin D family protein [Gordonia insulae]AZG45841.1 Outer membrane channel protein CpnT [Gordonia insulae]
MPTDIVYERYFQIARAADDASQHLADGAAVLISSLAGTGSMAGSDVAGNQWGAEYDAGAKTMISGITGTSAALVSFSSRVKQTAYNWAESDGLTSVPGEHRISGVTPIVADSLPPPSAVGDSGAGLQGVIDLVGEIGVPVPNGDTGKLVSAADAWNAFLGGGVASAIRSMESGGRIIVDDRSPEIDLIEGEFTTLKSAVDEVDAGVRHLGAASGEFKKTLDDLRSDIKDAVEQMIAEQVAATAVGIALSFVTAGIATAAGVGVAASRIASTARKIKGFIDLVKNSAKLSKTGKMVGHGLSELDTKIDEIVGRSPKTLSGKADDLPKPIPKSVQDTIDYARKPGSVSHVVDKPEHKLGPLVDQFESPADFVESLVRKVKEVPDLSPGTVYDARNPITVIVNGTEVEVRGSMTRQECSRSEPHTSRDELAGERCNCVQ